MGKSQTAGWTSASPTPAQLKEFFAQVETGRITKKRLQLFLRGDTSQPIKDLLLDWQSFYSDLGIAANFTGIHIPEKQPGFDRLIVMAQGITPQLAYGKCKELFPCWKWTDADMDEVIDFSFQTRSVKDGAYVVWFRDRIEADEELKNLSADDLKDKCIPGITLEERLVYELKHFKETEKHLDMDNVTLCSGSRCSFGGVPRVYWHSHLRELHVRWCYPGPAYDHLRSRQAVS